MQKNLKNTSKGIVIQKFAIPLIMRKKFIGANWKMNLLYDEAKLLYDNLSLR